mmetsp:Transcript_8229/g.25429  ORF Transcript_8229/g.25429 Transcript_8229/m.25429 type:complete len:215 (-) Transcript_8229:309-953(-)
MSKRPIVSVEGLSPAKSRRASSRSISFVSLVGSLPVSFLSAALTRRSTHANSREYSAFANACEAPSASAGVLGARTPATCRDTKASDSSLASTPRHCAAASRAFEGLPDVEASVADTTQPSAPSAVFLTSNVTSPKWHTAARPTKAEDSSTFSASIARRVASKASLSSTKRGGDDLPVASRRTACAVAESPRLGAPKAFFLSAGKPSTTWYSTW